MVGNGPFTNRKGTMYKISKERFGFQLTFAGKIDLAELTRWQDESKAALVGAPPSFGVLIDMRDLRPTDVQPEAQQTMVEGQALYKTAGMARSCVILKSATVTMQFKRLARESGIYTFEKYINASTNAHWYNEAMAWIEDGVDPDL